MFKRPVRESSGSRIAAWLLVLYASCPALGRASGARWAVSPFPGELGKPLQEVRDLLEDDAGAVWIATWGGGVTRVHRTEWRTFDETGGMPGNWTRSLELDDQGAVWIGTADGICRVRRETLEVDVYTVENTPALPSNDTRTIECLRDGTLWFAFRDAPVIVNCKVGDDGTPSWSRVADDQELAKPVRGLHQVPDGTVWAALEHGGLQRFADGAWSAPVDFEDREPTIRDFVDVPNGRVLGVGDYSLYDLGTTLPRKVDVPWEDSPRSAALSPNGELVVGTTHGVWFRHEGEWNSLDLAREYTVRSLLPSRGGHSLWLGTPDGLLRGRRAPWRRSDLTIQGHAIQPLSLCATASSQALAVDDASNVVRFDGKHWLPVCKVEDKDFRPRHVLPPEDGRLWALAESFLFLVALDSGQVLRKVPIPPGLSAPEDPITAPGNVLLFRTSKGALWLLAATEVYELRKEGWLPRRPEPWTSLEPPPSPRAITEAPDGSFYVAYRNFLHGTGHLERWIDGRVEIPSEDLRDHEIEAVYATTAGDIWIAAEDTGILIYDGESVQRVREQDGLTSNLVGRFLEASDGTMWVVYRRRGIGSFRDERWVNFGADDGIPLDHISQLVEDVSGRIWIATSTGLREGVFLYHPDVEAPETIIDAFPEKGIGSHGIGVFSFAGIDAWNQTRPERLQYSWRVSPVGGPRDADKWSPFTGQTAVATANPPLEPGTHVFEVRASDSERNVDPTPDSVVFSVESAFFARSEFLFPVTWLMLIAVASLALGYRKHVSLRAANRELLKQIAERERAEREQIRLEEELNQSQKLEAVGRLAAGVAHDVNNVLTAILGYAELIGSTTDNQQVNDWLHGIAEASSQASGVTEALLTFSRKTAVEKRPVQLSEVVVQSTKMLRHILSARIEMVVQTDDSLWVEADPTQLNQVVVNLAVNAGDAMPDGG